MTTEEKNVNQSVEENLSELRQIRRAKLKSIWDA